MARFSRIEVANVMKSTGLVPLFFHDDIEVATPAEELLELPVELV